MSKLIVGLARMLPLCASLLLLPGLAASQPAPLQPGLYMGMTSQGSVCSAPTIGHPSPTCDVRFNIAATLDRLSPSPRVEEIESANARCAGGTGAEWLVVSSCGGTIAAQALCTSSPPVLITNGHWEYHSHDPSPGGVSFDMVANCTGQSCTGTYSTSTLPTLTDPGCQTGTLTWSATATGSAPTSASAQTMEEAPVDGPVAWSHTQVDDQGVRRILIMPAESQ
jgi:hypothetical protein